MSEIEYIPEPSETGEEHELALAALTMVQELTMDEDPDVDRPDIWYVSWSDLQEPVEGYIDASELSHRNTAATQIQRLYIESLATLYPQLADAETKSEFDTQLATIPDAPLCNGSFSVSYYIAENGNHRMLAYVDTRLGDHMAMSIYISDIEPDIIKSYNLTMLPDMTILGSSAIRLRDQERQEQELLQKIEPSQRNTLHRIMYGNMMPDEVEIRLVEIKVLSMDITSEAELDEIINNAHARYKAVVEQQNDEVMNGMITLKIDDYNHMHDIFAERIDQLG